MNECELQFDKLKEAIMSTGRYHVVTKGGRRFTVEPIAERHQKIDGQVFKNGGLNGEETKNNQLGGSIREEDSIIKQENGYSRWVTLPPGVSPNGFIEALVNAPTVEDEDRLWNLYAK